MSLRVTVPCSTSNLGAGFDCIGLALSLHLTATFEPADESQVERTGTLPPLENPDDDIVAAMLAKHGITGRLTLDSNIPIGKGLGSSAAARVAGLAIIRAVGGSELDYEAMLTEATSLEGHPDNAAPAIIGGLIAVVSNGDALRPISLHLSEDIGFAFAAPQSTVSTKAARHALPDQVPHEVAARTIARSVALVEGLAEADPDLLRIGFADELHVPFRLGMIAGGRDAIDAAVATGAWAATVSGSGSGIIAVCTRGDESAVAHAMARAFERASAHEAIGFPIGPDFAGVQLERDP